MQKLVHYIEYKSHQDVCLLLETYYSVGIVDQLERKITFKAVQCGICSLLSFVTVNRPLLYAK
jgi:hypothetical protein